MHRQVPSRTFRSTLGVRGTPMSPEAYFGSPSATKKRTLPETDIQPRVEKKCRQHGHAVHRMIFEDGWAAG